LNILGINISHHTSVSFYKDKKIINFYEEDRFNNKKHFMVSKKEHFLLCLEEKLNFKPDVVCFSSFGRHGLISALPAYDNTSDDQIIELIQKQLGIKNSYFNAHNHHVYHLTNAFYFSNFEEAMGIVIDGGGAPNEHYQTYQELESIFYISKDKIVKKYQHLTNRRFTKVLPKIHDYSNYGMKEYINGTEYLFSSKASGGYLFSLIGEQIGLKEEAGKIMGLASYSKKNTNLDENKIKLAKYAQDVTFKDTCDLIEKAYNYKKIKNFVLSGGYFLNCSNNFKYVKKYPDLNFFVDPMPNDSGTASGICIYYENYL
jgi:predicted NodU family carbamoyl transferase